MESFWNSPDKVDLIRLIAQWIAAISGIIALVFAMQSSKLKSRADAMLKNSMKITNDELIHTKNEVNKAHDRISNIIVGAGSEEDEEKAFASGSKMVIRTDLLNKQPTKK